MKNEFYHSTAIISPELEKQSNSCSWKTYLDKINSKPILCVAKDHGRDLLLHCRKMAILVGALLGDKGVYASSSES